MIEPSSTHKKRRTLRGVVVSNAMKDTAVVLVTRYMRHPRYKKFMRRNKKYLAHDAGNTHEIGTRVSLEECRPISKRKAFRVVSSE